MNSVNVSELVISLPKESATVTSGFENGKCSSSIKEMVKLQSSVVISTTGT